MSAIAAGYSQHGFSDHSPWPYEDGYVSGIRMPLSQFPDYRRSVHALRERYSGQIEIFFGLEAEFYPGWHGWLKDLKEKNSLDYLILGSHFDNPYERDYFGGITSPDQIHRYTRHTIKAMQTGLFSCLAHPDLFMMSYAAFDEDCAAASRDICQAARDLDIPLEYNLSGFYPQSWRKGVGYPAPGFWQIAAQEGASAILGLDAHNPQRYADTAVYDKAAMDLDAMGIPLVHSLIPHRAQEKLAI